eukprot:GHVT01092194.1.p1 GENE.GHVT01092194.1~~GHVT01092194.1.p1  ORF type:complete len:159 (+),score=29.27 GHVT01092194.1:1866-2342(+)
MLEPAQVIELPALPVTGAATGRPVKRSDDTSPRGKPPTVLAGGGDASVAQPAELQPSVKVDTAGVAPAADSSKAREKETNSEGASAATAGSSASSDVAASTCPSVLPPVHELNGKRIRLRGSKFQRCMSIQIFVDDNHGNCAHTYINRLILYGYPLET